MRQVRLPARSALPPPLLLAAAGRGGRGGGAGRRSGAAGTSPVQWTVVTAQCRAQLLVTVFRQQATDSRQQTEGNRQLAADSRQ